MRTTRTLLAAVVAASFVFAAAHASAVTVEHVIQISVDGMGGTSLEALINGSPATYPNFIRLQNQGSYTYNARTDFTHSVTIPDHASMITGRPVSQPAGQPNTVHHGYTSDFPGANDTFHNSGNLNVPYKASTFDVAHDNGLSTSAFLSKDRLAIFDRSYNATNGAPDTIGADNGRDKIDAYLNTPNTATVTSAFLTDFETNNRNYGFLHLVDPDTVGHQSGWNSAAWNASVATTDANLGSVLNFIDTHPEFTNNTVVILTADHGGSGSNHTDASNPANYTIPVFLWGPGIPVGDLYALAANRVNPGSTRPDYNAVGQPIRNGDTGNLALSFLGLGPIPGSSMQMQLVPEPGTVVLALAGLVLLAVHGHGRRRA
jgi:hypothetical protein